VRQRYGTFEDPLAGKAAVMQPQTAAWRELLEGDPVLDRDGTTPLVLSRREDIVFVNQHPAVLGNGSAGPAMGGDQKVIPLDLDGPDHRKFRRLLDPLFAPKSKVSQIASLEPIVRRMANELIDGFAARGSVEFYEEFAAKLPTIIFVDMLGLPQDDRQFFLDFVSDIIRPEGETYDERNAVRAAAPPRMFAYLAEAMEKRRPDPDAYPGLITGLMQIEIEGERLTDREALNIMFLLMIAGLDTVTASLSCLVSWLGRHPEERKAIVEDPSLLPAAIEELMRFESPVQWGHRVATEDITLPSGVTVKAGEDMQLVWAAGNVDESFFPNATTVDLRRPDSRKHIAFASGAHRCLGSHLARLEMRCALEELHRRIPDYRVTDESALVYGAGTVRAVLNLPLEFTPA
jgi:cytochrome P450